MEEEEVLLTTNGCHCMFSLLYINFKRGVKSGRGMNKKEVRWNNNMDTEWWKDDRRGVKLCIILKKPDFRLLLLHVLQMNVKIWRPVGKMSFFGSGSIIEPKSSPVLSDFFANKTPQKELLESCYTCQFLLSSVILSWNRFSCNEFNCTE